MSEYLFAVKFVGRVLWMRLTGRVSMLGLLNDVLEASSTGAISNSAAVELVKGLHALMWRGRPQVQPDRAQDYREDMQRFQESLAVLRRCAAVEAAIKEAEESA